MLLDKGVTDPKVIAKKLGYKGNALTSGIERVREIMKGVGHEPTPKDIDNFLRRNKII